MCRFFRMGLLYYLVGVVPSSRLAPSYCYIIGCIPAQSFLCTWPAGQFNIGISPSMQAAHSLIWWSLNRSAQIQALHQRLPCRCLFRLPKKRSDCDCFFLLLGFTYTSPMLPVRPWNDGHFFFGHLFHGLWWGHTGSFSHKVLCCSDSQALCRGWATTQLWWEGSLQLHCAGSTWWVLLSCK